MASFTYAEELLSWWLWPFRVASICSCESNMKKRTSKLCIWPPQLSRSLVSLQLTIWKIMISGFHVCCCQDLDFDVLHLWGSVFQAPAWVESIYVTLHSNNFRRLPKKHSVEIQMGLSSCQDLASASHPLAIFLASAHIGIRKKCFFPNGLSAPHPPKHHHHIYSLELRGAQIGHMADISTADMAEMLWHLGANDQPAQPADRRTKRERRTEWWLVTHKTVTSVLGSS